MRAARGSSVLLALALSAGCAGATTPSVAPATPSATTAASEPAAPSAATSERCDQAHDEIQAALTPFRDTITNIEVDGCRLATVTTTLQATADGAKTAASLCQNAAGEASNHGVAQTIMTAADGTELATGHSEMDCAARPVK